MENNGGGVLLLLLSSCCIRSFFFLFAQRAEHTRRFPSLSHSDFYCYFFVSFFLPSPYPHSPRRWTDLHNFIASTTGRTVQELEVQVMEKQESLIIPPHFLSYYYFRWARTADPLLYQNPVWWQCIEWVNLLCLMPFALIAARAFYKGYNWIRTPAIIVSSFTFYSLILCIGTTFFHELPEVSRTRQSLIFFFIYVPYLIFPALVTARVWQDSPFSKPLDAVLDKIIKVVASLTYFCFVAAGILWYFRCEMSAEVQQACKDTKLPYPNGGTVDPTIISIALYVFGFAYGLAIVTIGKFIYDQEKATSSSSSSSGSKKSA
jgi:hypothetical protein